MRVIVANKFWYRRGGLERVMFDEIEWLEAAGHEVAHFSTAHPDNVTSPWSEYFVPYLELGSTRALPAREAAVAVARMFANGEARRGFERLLDGFRPDVVHVHGIHRQVSPSILAPARARGIPVVQTLHDYHHVCPNDALLREGVEPCEPRRCGPLDYSAAVGCRCVRGSLGASFLSAAETAWQRVRGAYERGVSRFVSPSRFMAAAMTSGGWEVPIDVVPNAVPGRPEHRGSHEHLLYAGRLAPEKGVGIALLSARMSGVPIVVAGEGPLERRLRAEFPEARFVGRVGGDEIEALMSRAYATVVPSIWYENASMTVLEAMAAGVAVVASRIGGIPEQVADGVEGILVAPGDVAGMAAAMRRLAEDSALRVRLGAAGRRSVAEKYAPRRHTEALLATYRQAMAG